MDVRRDVRRDDRTGVWLIDCMGVHTGDRVDVYRAVRRAVCRDDCTVYGRLQNLPSILALRVSRALELRIGL